MSVTLAAMLKKFKLDNTGDMLVLQDYTRHPQMPWYAELFSFLTGLVVFAVAFLGTLAFGFMASNMVLWVAAIISAIWLAATLFWFLKMVNVWTLAICPLMVAVGFAALVALVVLLTRGAAWPIIPAFAAALALARIKVSFALSFIATLVVCILALSAVGSVLWHPDYVIGSMSLLAAAMSFGLFMLPLARWDWRGHAFALLAFSLALLMFVYIARQLMFNIDIAQPIEYAMKAASALFILWGYVYSSEKWKGKKGSRKQRLYALAWLVALMAIVIWLFWAGVIMGMAAIMLGYMLASRAMMILGFLSAGAFAITTYVYLSNWIISSGFFIFVESVFIYFWRG
ncbi:MAG: hypothetical protein FWF01_01740 [Alphaproteobacteria bacterium]|nr:hypothetical protein [Alphaproteobacteria bacterium]